MTAQTNNASSKRRTAVKTTAATAERRAAAATKIKLLPVFVLLALVFAVVLPPMLSLTLGAAGRVISSIPHWLSTLSLGGRPAYIAPMFTPQVDYWGNDIQRWAQQFSLDPNLLATVMQIESCGYDTVTSSANAQGLFQVMPFHFSDGENMLDPDTNARRGASFLNECLGYANGDPGLALACYNGGPSVLQRNFSTWHAETQRYYTWGTAIYMDAQQNKSSSQALQDWLNAGGESLCQRASARLGL